MPKHSPLAVELIKKPIKGAIIGFRNRGYTVYVYENTQVDIEIFGHKRYVSLRRRGNTIERVIETNNLDEATEAAIHSVSDKIGAWYPSFRTIGIR